MKALIVAPVFWILHACAPDPVQPGIACEVIAISPERGEALLRCDAVEIRLKESTQ